MNRREFLQQVSCALAVAGIASTIPEHVHAKERGGWTATTITLPYPARITGMTMFRDMLVITCEDGSVWTIANALEQVETYKFDDNRIHLNMRPGVWGDQITIELSGRLPPPVMAENVRFVTSVWIPQPFYWEPAT